MKKILIIGSCGSGKSTVAIRLSEQLQIAVKHLDRFYWRPGWVKPTDDEWRNTVKQLLTDESWIIDGNYSGTLDLRLASCDTIVFLDLNRFLCMWRVFKRLFMYRTVTRPDMAEGCPEKIDLEFVLWVWNYSRRSRPKVIKLLSECAETKRVVWLNSRSEVERFLTSGVAHANGNSDQANQDANS